MAAAGIHEIQALPRAFRRGRGLTGRVAETGQYLIFEDVRSDPRYRQMTENNAMQRMGDCFIAIFPIKAKEKFLGTINCINKEPRKLTTAEIRLINSMADPIGVAVENISLFEEVDTHCLPRRPTYRGRERALPSALLYLRDHCRADSDQWRITTKAIASVCPNAGANGISDIHSALHSQFDVHSPYLALARMTHESVSDSCLLLAWKWF
jgi:GAF domain